MKNLSFIFAILIALFFIASCNTPTGTQQTAKPKLPTGDYFGFTVGTTAEIFAKGIVSREFQELNAVFSPDGNEFYFTIADPYRNFYTIVFYKRNKNDEWEGPEVAPFSGSYADADPSFSSDGSRLFFISQRPLNDSTTTSKDFDIWAVDRTEAGWGKPINLDFLNTKTNEFYVSTTDAGSIFFSAQYKDGLGRGDIYEARRSDDGIMSIENLGEAINSPTGDGDPYVSPDGKMMIFMSWGREDDLGGGDLYISFKQDGEWSKAKNLGPKINSNQFEYCPMMSPDGKYFFWTSYRTSNYNSPNPRGYQALESRLSGTDNGLGNVYWIDAKVLEEFRD
jgi:hypothetical protein